MNNCCPACSYEWESINPPSKCPFCEINLKESEQPMSNYSEQDWESAMRYGEEHASEFTTPQKQLENRAVRDLCTTLFDDAVALARTRAAELRGGAR